MDDLVNLIIIGLVALFALMSGKKRKKPPPAPPPRRPVRAARPTPQERPRPVSTAVRDRKPVAGVPDRAKTAEPARPRDLAEELLQFLQGRVPQTQPAAPAVTPPEALPEPDEARSLERLEGADAETHKRFHELYMEPAPALDAPKSGRFTKARLELRGKSLREAFVLKEVLGPPKGME